MLYLVFQLGQDRYAIEASQIVEVLPLVIPKQIPQAPLGVAGVFDYHGTAVPLIDLAELTFGKASRKWMSTRIILVKYEGHGGEIYSLGLIAEQATETIRRNEEDFASAGLAISDSPYLGNVTRDASGLVQRIEVAKLLSEDLRTSCSANV